MQSALNVAQQLLCSMDIAVLKRLGPYQYELDGVPPQFYLNLFPPQANEPACTKPWEASLMMDSFIEDVEFFFNCPETAPLSSGIWIEEFKNSGEIPLISQALKIGNMQLLIIRSISNEYEEKARILNNLRTQVIERRHISGELEFFKARSNFDPLTKVYNRNMFEEVVQQHVSSVGKRALDLALLMLDIDNFKQVNDTYGHLKGDQVLVELASILKASIREDDFLIRYGGEEFCVLAHNSTLSQSIYFANKLRLCIEKHDFGTKEKITISIGVSMHCSGDNVHKFVHRADTALYQAKRTGKNRVCYLL